ncbi:MAG: purine-nucleoside phosphorylase [Clostridia bacterium]|nr:purine-nucleoside phosphorylase [Clostridia bacterium]
MPVSTPHITAPPVPYAKTVLMPGDPLRSEYMAKKYLDDPILVNNVRGVRGYTGTYKGRPVSIMASGMGAPSIGIYSHELFSFFGVESIIRIGSMGAYRPSLSVRQLVIAISASTDSNFISQFSLPGTFAPTADWSLLKKAAETAEKEKMNYTVGSVLTSDRFYNDDPDSYKKWAKMGIMGVEMETAALYSVAARLGKKALSILTVSDNLETGEELSSEERQTSFDDMVILALELTE